MSRNECERLADLAQGKRVLEVGAHYGRSTIALASTARRVFSVDWHRGDDYTKDWGFTLGPYVRNLIKYEVLDNVAIVVADAADMEVLADDSFDLVFIDADHSYQAVKGYIELFTPKAKRGAPICFHDYTVAGCFEHQAVDEHFVVDDLVDSMAVVHRP